MAPGQVAATVRRPATACGHDPATTATHAQRPCRTGRRPKRPRRGLPWQYSVVIPIKPVGTPFKNVPIHVTQAPRIRLLLAHRMRRLVRVLVIPGVLAQAQLAVAKIVPARASRSARVFPLRLGRQPVVALRHATLLGKPLQKRLAILPADRLHRVLRPLDRAGVVAHHLLPLLLRNLVPAQEEGLGDTDPVGTAALAHRELARRDQHELHADGVGCLDRHAQVSSPGLLILLGLCGIEGGHGQWRQGRQARGRARHV